MHKLKEMRAMVYGCERFQRFIFGIRATIQTDPRPLIGIIKNQYTEINYYIIVNETVCIKKYMTLN